MMNRPRTPVEGLEKDCAVGLESSCTRGHHGLGIAAPHEKRRVPSAAAEPASVLSAVPVLAPPLPNRTRSAGSAASCALPPVLHLSPAFFQFPSSPRTSTPSSHAFSSGADDELFPN